MTHLERVQKAIDHIEEHLGDDLSIDELARVAAFSPWHFQRVFSAMVGETAGSYIRRRRLTCALMELATTGRKIADIAWDHRFESQEAFTRAFKSMFGCTPGRYRKGDSQGVPLPCAAGRPRITQEHLDRLYGEMRMEPVVRQLGEIMVVGPGARFISILSPEANNSNIIPQLWGGLCERLGEIRHAVEGPNYGLCEMLPKGERTREDEFFYIAGCQVESLDDIPEGMSGRSLPPTTYLAFTHKGKLDTLRGTMDYIYGSWLPSSSYERAPGPDLELYDERFDPDSDTSEIDILIPVREGSGSR